MLKRMLFCAVLMAMLTATHAQTLKTPQPSPTQTVKQDFGTSTIELTYSRPSLKGRKLFTDLAPYGQLWRTGANGATRIKFDDDVTLGGTPVKAGEYVLYTIPGQSDWDVIINKGLDNWGADGYSQGADVARFKVKSMTTSMPVETFTMQFANIKSASADLQLLWGTTAVAIPITTDVNTRIMAQIDDAMNKDNRPYFQSAMFYMENGKDLAQAITWFDKALAQNPKAFWIYHQKANALAKQGKRDEAKQTALKSIELAKEAKNTDYVQLNEKLIASLK